MIHHFMILRRSGENIYHQSFGSIDMDVTIMGGFFSAFFTFTQTVWDTDIHDIELGPYRIIFEFTANDLILALIFDKSYSLVHYQLRLTELKNIIDVNYSASLQSSACRSEDFEDLGQIVDQVLLKPGIDGLEADELDKTMALLERLSSHREILDCALISIDGVPLLEDVRKDYLSLTIKQMDAFWKFKKRQALDQIILYYENKCIILYKVNDNFILAVLTHRATPVGLATLLIEEAATGIARVIQKK